MEYFSLCFLCISFTAPVKVKFGPSMPDSPALARCGKSANLAESYAMLETQKESSGDAEGELVGLAVTDRREPEKPQKPKEIGGPKGAEPTRYGDWERAGRCIDF